MSAVYISLPKNKRSRGGGASTFAQNFKTWAEKNGFKISSSPLTCHSALIIADKASIATLLTLKLLGKKIIHRLDEFFEDNETPARKIKHKRIKKINKLADITVYQSKFVEENAGRYLNPVKSAVILNGGQSERFFPTEKAGSFIGHVTWGVDNRKGLRDLEQVIKKYSSQKFLLIGNHNRSNIDFSTYENVTLKGPVARDEIADYYRKMKCLYFPSVNDPCPNTVVEAILCGVPVCYHNSGGTPELVKSCGVPLEKFEAILEKPESYRQKCLERNDLDFNNCALKYAELLLGNKAP